MGHGNRTMEDLDPADHFGRNLSPRGGGQSLVARRDAHFYKAHAADALALRPALEHTGVGASTPADTCVDEFSTY
jgi:hypothetical protein